jgi:hypothetical protein
MTDIRCKFGFHDWSQHCGQCARCGHTRTPKHSWQDNGHTDKCTLCGITFSQTQTAESIVQQMQRAMPGINFKKIAIEVRLIELWNNENTWGKDAFNCLVENILKDPSRYIEFPDFPSTFNKCYSSCRSCRGCCP